jgi:cytochrome bd-type quinol oxidase subunit 1
LSEAWKRLDLGGDGLQRTNLELAGRLKRRGRAWALLLAAPLGLHRAYLEDRTGAWLWRAASLVAVGTAFWNLRLAAGIGVAMLAAAAIDAWWIDRRVTRLNKRIRRDVFLGGEAPPAGYTGRVIEAPGGRAPSFAEQERLLRSLARGRGRDDSASAEPDAR